MEGGQGKKVEGRTWRIRKRVKLGREEEARRENE